MVVREKLKTASQVSYLSQLERMWWNLVKDCRYKKAPLMRGFNDMYGA